jgi:hypothetical protein
MTSATCANVPLGIHIPGQKSPKARVVLHYPAGHGLILFQQEGKAHIQAALDLDLASRSFASVNITIGCEKSSDEVNLGWSRRVTADADGLAGGQVLAHVQVTISKAVQVGSLDLVPRKGTTGIVYRGLDLVAPWKVKSLHNISHCPPTDTQPPTDLLGGFSQLIVPVVKLFPRDGSALTGPIALAATKLFVRLFNNPATLWTPLSFHNNPTLSQPVTGGRIANPAPAPSSQSRNLAATFCRCMIVLLSHFILASPTPATKTATRQRWLWWPLESML